MWLGYEQRESKVHPEINSDDLITRLGKLKRLILYEFYMKPMANRLSNHYTKTLPEGVQITTGVQELLCSLRNTSRDLHPSHTEKVILDYMQSSGRVGIPSR